MRRSARENASLERLALRARRLSEGESAPSYNLVLTALDAELRALAARYDATTAEDGEAAWIPISDAVARGLRGALADAVAEPVCQVEVDGSVQRWDVGDGLVLTRVVAHLPAELGSYARARFVVAKAALDARLKEPGTFSLCIAKSTVCNNRKRNSFWSDFSKSNQ
jgi:hypothetical protein